MRIQNSFAAAVAAAVAAVVFSAAMQPVQASIIVLDDFTQAGGGSANGSTATVATSDFTSGSFGGFADRESAAGYSQSTTRGSRTVVAESDGLGLGTLSLINNGAGTGLTSTGGAIAYFAYLQGASPVDLTGQQYAGFWIETGATSLTPAGAFTGYVAVTTNGANGLQSAEVLLPGMWAPNTGTGILFSQLTAVNPALEFTDTAEVYVGFRNTNTLAGSTAYNGTATFTAISVPEPTQMVSVAAVGAMFGAWRLRKLRRARPAASEAIAG